MSAVFVTGTDTNVGKTIASAALVAAWNADYWKPAQTGWPQDDDTRAVTDLARLAPPRVHASQYALPEPVSPHLAARLAGTSIHLADFTLPATNRPLVVEGAGGLLVPLNDKHTMADLVTHLRLPAVIVARTTLGTINHTLLTLEAARARGIRVLGVLLSGPENQENAQAITHHGRTRVLAHLPLLTRITPDAVQELARRVPPLSEVLA